MMKRKPLLFIVVGVLAAALLLCLYLSTRNSSTAYEETLITYLEALKEGTDKAIQSTYHDFYALGNGSNWGVYI